MDFVKNLLTGFAILLVAIILFVSLGLAIIVDLALLVNLFANGPRMTTGEMIAGMWLSSGLVLKLLYIVGTIIVIFLIGELGNWFLEETAPYGAKKGKYKKPKVS